MAQKSLPSRVATTTLLLTFGYKRPLHRFSVPAAGVAARASSKGGAIKLALASQLHVDSARFGFLSCNLPCLPFTHSSLPCVLEIWIAMDFWLALGSWIQSSMPFISCLLIFELGSLASGLMTDSDWFWTRCKDTIPHPISSFPF